MTTTDIHVVFVRLLGEGTEVMRPVHALLENSGCYRLLAPSDYDCEEETWEFPPNSIVLCKVQVNSGEWIRVATERLV
ncbi:MAG: hypothetical protein RLZZ157_147 [Pseudomonadota bacterium]|jgi:hypothetical protein